MDILECMISPCTEWAVESTAPVGDDGKIHWFPSKCNVSFYSVLPHSLFTKWGFVSVAKENLVSGLTLLMIFV